MSDGIWEAPLELWLSDEDFEAEFGRERTAEEHQAHEMYLDALAFSDPETWLEAGPDDGTGGERL